MVHYSPLWHLICYLMRALVGLPLPWQACCWRWVGLHDCCWLHEVHGSMALSAATRVQAMRAVEVPVYDFRCHQRSGETRKVDPTDVVIIEGILILHMEEVRLLLADLCARS